MTMTPEDNYVPFGLEWEKEIMKMNKQHIVLMYKKACIAKKQLEADLASSATPAGDGWRWVKVSDKHPDTYDWPELHYRLDGKKSDGILVEAKDGGPVFEYRDYVRGWQIVEDLSRVEWLCESPKTVEETVDGWVTVSGKKYLLVNSQLFTVVSFDEHEDGDFEADAEDGSYRVLISHNGVTIRDGLYVSNAVNGYGNNCKNDFRDAKITLLTPLPAPPVK